MEKTFKVKDYNVSEVLTNIEEVYGRTMQVCIIDDEETGRIYFCDPVSSLKYNYDVRNIIDHNVTRVTVTTQAYGLFTKTTCITVYIKD